MTLNGVTTADARYLWSSWASRLLCKMMESKAWRRYIQTLRVTYVHKVMQARMIEVALSGRWHSLFLGPTISYWHITSRCIGRARVAGSLCLCHGKTNADEQHAWDWDEIRTFWAQFVQLQNLKPNRNKMKSVVKYISESHENQCLVINWC